MLDSQKIRKIVVTIAIYVVAFVIIGGLGRLEILSPSMVFLLLGIGFLLSALSWEVIGNLLLAGFTGLSAGVLNLLSLPLGESVMPPVLIFTATAAVIGTGIGLFNRSERTRRVKPEAIKYFPSDIFQRAQNPMLILDGDGRVTERNDRAVEILGSVKHFTEIIHFEDLDRARAELERTLRMGEAQGIELRGVTWDKNTFHSEIRMRRIAENQIWIEMDDLSDRLDLERKLWEAEARYRYLIEDAIDTLDTGIVLLDQESRIIWVNETLGHLFAVDRDEMIGADLKTLLNETNRRFVEENVMSDILGAGNHSFIFTMNDGFEEKILEFRSIPIETERYRGGRIDHYIDLTEIKKLERELVQYSERLEESNQKLEEFSHVVSHDLKQPLRTIQAFSQFIIDDYSQKLDEEGLDYLKSLQRSSVRMKSLIDDLLNLSSIGTKNQPVEQIEISDIIEDVREDLSALLNDVQFTVTGELPSIVANRTRTHELFANLISNGVKYNDKENKQIMIECEETPNEYLFRVRDNGVGIDPRYQHKIFELFERLNPAADPDSTGAGLAITKRIVSEMGGRIWVDSEVNQGSTFSFSVPKRSRVETRVHQHT